MRLGIDENDRSANYILYFLLFVLDSIQTVLRSLIFDNEYFAFWLLLSLILYPIGSNK